MLGASGESVEIPGLDFLISADFVRSGPSLILKGEDGGAILVRVFFATGPPPDLTAYGGARISA